MSTITRERELLEEYLDRGTWGREARRVVLLAAEAGIVLDRETLIHYDVRELAALRGSLERRLAGGAPRRHAGPGRLTGGDSDDDAAERMMKGDTMTVR